MTNKSVRRRRQRQRRKRIITTVFLLLFLVLIAGGAAFMIYTLKGGAFSGVARQYSAEELFEGTLTKQKNLKAETFAEKLCIVEGDVLTLDSVSLEEGQEALLLNLDDRKVLYSKSAFDKVYPASITKIMTAMLAMKYGNMDETVTITAENLNLEEGSQVCGFQAGDRVTVDQLLHCLLVYSGNDAAAALAEYIAGSTSAFVDMMNSYAANLGCTGTHFTNPHGLQDENHYTTPYDIYLMLNEALKYPEFTEITQLSSYTVTYTRADGSQMSTALEATDHYLTGEATAPKDVTVLGGKTGTTSDAGNCLALLSQNAFGKPYVSIVMGASTKDLLYVQMNSLLQYINQA
ncbi:MAG: serine hydrolase [Blautia sp.]|nr:serine hydrolase [Blautia sp.]